jgi:hypothetical protein
MEASIDSAGDSMPSGALHLDYLRMSDGAEKAIRQRWNGSFMSWTMQGFLRAVDLIRYCR